MAWPQRNAVVERFMKPIGKLLKTAEIKGKNWRQELQRFLLQYRSTPHQTTKVASSELLFNRKIRGYLPELTNKHKMAKKTWRRRKKRIRSIMIEIGEQKKWTSERETLLFVSRKRRIN